MGDKSKLHEAVVCPHLSFDSVSIGFVLSVQVLVSVVALEGCHARHPEVIEKCADNVNGLFEGYFDFEPLAIELDDIGGLQLEVRAHEQAFASRRVMRGDEADQSAHGLPEQVEGPYL